jgi:hypothetical protein
MWLSRCFLQEMLIQVDLVIVPPRQSIYFYMTKSFLTSTSLTSCYDSSKLCIQQAVMRTTFSAWP